MFIRNLQVYFLKHLATIQRKILTGEYFDKFDEF